MKEAASAFRALSLPEEVIRQRIVEISPEIRHDVNIMADMIRKLVALERDKLGLDENCGRIDLAPNHAKKSSADPDLVGSGLYAGNRIEAAAWAGKNGKIRISVIQKPVRKN